MKSGLKYTQSFGKCSEQDKTFSHTCSQRAVGFGVRRQQREKGYPLRAAGANRTVAPGRSAPLQGVRSGGGSPGAGRKWLPSKAASEVVPRRIAAGRPVVRPSSSGGCGLHPERRWGLFSSLAARPLVVFECSRQMDPGRFAVWKERKEVKEMNTLVIVLIAAVCLLGAYTFYGRWLANKWGIDPKAKTPQSSTRTAATTSPPTAGPFLPISSAPSQVPALSPVPSRLPHSAGCPFCCGS